MNIIIDPYMLGLSDTSEIKNNIPFFQTLIYLCNSGRVNVYLYEELVQKMLAREITPFPISLGTVRDETLRLQIMNLNRAFVNVVMNNINRIDIEECGGEQSFDVRGEQREVIENLKTDSAYFELLSILLQPCYNKQLKLSTDILTGDTKKGRKIGDIFELVCNCKKSQYSEVYKFSSISELESEKDKARMVLNQKAVDGLFNMVDSPLIIRGEHHNKLQFNSDFTSFEGLSRANKSVLTLLRKFGLSKIIFGEFHEDASRAKGTIIVYDVRVTDDNEILRGWLFSETGFKNHVDLYFPKEVGNNMRLVLNDEFSRNNVERLVDSLF